MSISRDDNHYTTGSMVRFVTRQTKLGYLLTLVFFFLKQLYDLVTLFNDVQSFEEAIYNKSIILG